MFKLQLIEINEDYQCLAKLPDLSILGLMTNSQKKGTVSQWCP